MTDKPKTPPLDNARIRDIAEVEVPRVVVEEPSP